jgi:hypothetical protein
MRSDQPMIAPFEAQDYNEELPPAGYDPIGMKNNLR